MGLFQHKQDGKKKLSEEEMLSAEEHFFDEYFREELRNHGRWYFEKVINQNGQLFKEDLQETITQVNVELKEHITKQLDAAIARIDAELKDHTTKQLQDQFAEYGESLKTAQAEALKLVTESAQKLQEQHKELSIALDKNVTEQQSLLHAAFDENKSQITAMKDAQDSALKWLNQSAQELHDKYREISETLDKNVKAQQQLMVEGFQNNMAAVIEHYLLESLGEQFDLKAQLPAIIQQMEAHKQEIVDDMQL